MLSYISTNDSSVTEKTPAVNAGVIKLVGVKREFSET
jgi:hypothetical protein